MRSKIAVKFMASSCIIFLSACQSSAEKLARLETDKVVACLSAERYYDELKRADPDTPEELRARVEARDRGDSATADALDSAYRARRHAAGIDTLAEKWSRQRAACELATRKYESYGR